MKMTHQYDEDINENDLNVDKNRIATESEGSDSDDDTPLLGSVYSCENSSKIENRETQQKIGDKRPYSIFKV